MRIGRLLLAALVALGTVAVTAAGDDGDDRVAEALTPDLLRYVTVGDPGPLGPITVFGDSVLLGSQLFGPTLPEQLIARGWGPVRLLAGAGFNTGKPLRAPSAARITTWIERWPTEGWDTEPWVINLGANDSDFCPDTDRACMRDTITHVLDALGPDKRVWWAQMTLQPDRAAEQFTWNTALAELAAERPNLDTWDWPTEMANGPYPSGDNIHLSPDGYRLRSARMAQLITARLGEGRPSGTPAPALPATIAAPSGFVPVDAQRMVDTRTDSPGRLRTGSVLTLDLSDVVPEGSTAAALYVTAVRPGQRGHLTVAPCGAPSDASTVNFAPGVTRGAPTLTEIGDDGTVCVTAVGDADVTVDLQGAFHPTDDRAVGFDPETVPRRLADTRTTGLMSRLVVDAPAGADAVAVNLTAVGSSTVGHVVAGPCDRRSTVANLNFGPGAPVAASAIIEVGTDGTFCLETVNDTHLVVDLTGTFSATGDLRFVPVTPTRMLDTRIGTGGWEILHGAGQVVRFRAAPADARAVSGTITLVNPLSPAFLTGFGCAGSPGTSSVNGAEFAVTPNSLTSSIDGGDLCIGASSGTHTLFDTTGWWVAA